MRTGARATKQNYISIYISLSMKTLLKTGVYIYIYIYIYISFVFSQSRAKVSAGLTDVSGLAVATFIFV